MGLTRIRADQVANLGYTTVRVIALTNVVLNGGAPLTVDGVALATNSRVLVAGQDTAAQNGIYRVGTAGTGSDGTWVRAPDFDQTGEIEAGLTVMVTEGTEFEDTLFKLITNNPIVVGETALAFAQNSAFDFGNIVANGTAIIASSESDTVTFTAGNNVLLTANAESKTINFDILTGAAVAAAGNAGDIQFNSNGSLGASGNLTFVGSELSVTGTVAATGNVTTGNVSGTTGAFTTVTGNGRALTSLNATNIDTGTLPSGRLSGTYTITVSGAATTAATVTTAAQPNITSVGTLTALTMGGLLAGVNSAATDVNTANDSGSFSARGNTTTVASMTFHRNNAFAINMGLGVDNIFRIGGFSASNNCMQLSGTGAMTILGSMTVNSAGGATAIVNAAGNGVGNIGSSTAVFNTVFAKATSAQYADVAEKYQADADYPPGTVLIFGGDHEVTVSGNSHSTDIAGVVSTDPAYIMNSGLNSGHVATVALLGRVPCRVVGMVRKGQCVVASDQPGTACALDPGQYQPGCIIGKALEDYNSDLPGTIEVVAGRV